ncbi:MAG: flagellar M-ring protein FliF [Anaerolineaceae bacterium]|nr:flagellar M-ring protein FliF [Anaerolineaceae bacterium]
MLANIIEQFQKIWKEQSQTQRLVLIAVVVILAILIPTMIAMANRPSYGVAFSRLSEEDAGAIVQKLQTENITYQLREGNTILVPTDRVYDVRLMMATEGLPKGGSVGFELFDTNTLGMTEFTQRVAYQRALEGELERTISSLDAVDGVRVHIVTPEKSLLTSEQSPTTASVTIRESSGQMMTSSQIQSITSLVANSVEGLDAQNVVIVDTEGNLLATGTGDDAYGGSISQSDNRRSVELAAAKDIEIKVKNMLNTALGPNRSVVQVYINMDWTEKEITSETFDATPIVSSESTVNEIYTTDMTELSGIPGATSNLPTTADDTTAAQTADGTTPLYQRDEAITNYELSSVQSHEIIHPGEIERVSLSVLVDGVTDEDQLAVLQDAIVAAAGIDIVRGDLVSVQSLTFDRTYEETTAEEIATQESQTLIITIAQYAGIGLLLLLVFWYISRLLKNLKMASVEVWTPVLQPVSQMSGLQSDSDRILFVEDSNKGSTTTDIAQSGKEEKVEEKPKIDLEKLVKEKIKLPTAEEEQMARLVNRVAEENPSSIAEIIQMWLSQDRTND